MRSFRNFATTISITLLLFGLLGSTVMGQVAPPQANLDRDNAVALKQLAMAEDMQIMGQIIDKAIERLYQGRTDKPVKYTDMAMMSSGPVVPGDNKDKTDRIDKALAVFLDGYGVVYQLEAPLLYTPSATTNKKPASCPFLELTRWEKTQLNLTGAVNGKHCSQCHGSSKSYYQAALVFQSVLNQQRVRYSNRVQLVTAPTRDQLVSELLDILAENGHNFRNLKSQEQIKISITLRKLRQQTTKVNEPFSSMSDSSTDRYRYVYGAMGMGMLPGRNNPSSAGATSSTPSKKNVKDKNTKSNTDNSQGLFRDSKSKSTNATEVNRRLFEQGYVYKNPRRYLINLSTGEPSQLLWTAADEPSSDVQNQILRGDLLMRQGKLDAAAKAFEAAIKKQFGRDPYGESDFGKKFRTDVPANRKLIEKLARALIGAGQYEKAQSLLEHIQD